MLSTSTHPLETRQHNIKLSIAWPCHMICIYISAYFIGLELFLSHKKISKYYANENEAARQRSATKILIEKTQLWDKS